MLNRTPLFSAAALLSITAFLYFSNPERVAVNINGDIIGITNKTRSYLQGSKFWKKQLHLTNSEIEYCIDFPQKLSRVNKLKDELMQSLEDNNSKFGISDEDIKRIFPERDPNDPDTVRAKALRYKAERLEERASTRRMLRRNQLRLADLYKIKSIILKRLKG
tara:strand:- start:2587 stop:3075 length:489 start_codon:yes stop_codon:yes gene_type:complete